MKKIWLTVVFGWISMFFIIFFLAGKIALAAEPEAFGVQKYKERKPAPLFSMDDLDGKRVSLGDFKGRPVLVGFWATW